jgi:hypothetical protein
MIYPVLECPPELKSQTEFMEKCKEFIDYYAPKDDTLEDEGLNSFWKEALEADIMQTHLGVLLCALPNLKELYLGASWLMDFPMFGSVATRQRRPWAPVDWGCFIDHVG